ncbi:MAG: metallophosphoesterase [Oscillospiraceae bacterium]|nr:metallophosphoesterase [Oscillospiraceae bacterium]
MTFGIPRHGGAPLHTFPPRIRQLVLPPGRRILAVSDVHGSLCYLKGLLEKAAFSPDDILILVGDLLEKGPDSLAVLRYIISLSETHTVHFVTGNCDWWYPFLYQVGSPESNLWYFQHAPNCLLRQMCDELGIAPGPDMDYLRLRDTAAEAFPREFGFFAPRAGNSGNAALYLCPRRPAAGRTGELGRMELPEIRQLSDLRADI